LGPAATAYFYSLVTKMTNAQREQNHLELLIYSKPSIPDRTEFILDQCKENPLYPMLEAGKTLTSQGADLIAIPCITAHYFYEQLVKEIKIPIIHVIKETVQYLKEHRIQSVGVMATNGTIGSKLIQDELERNKITIKLPSKEKQKFTMDIIYDNVKACRPLEMEKFYEVSEELKREGAEVILLACSELSIIKGMRNIGSGFLDMMEVLAMRSVLLCEGELKEEYRSLISK